MSDRQRSPRQFAARRFRFQRRIAKASRGSIIRIPPLIFLHAALERATAVTEAIAVAFPGTDSALQVHPLVIKLFGPRVVIGDGACVERIGLVAAVRRDAW